MLSNEIRKSMLIRWLKSSSLPQCDPQVSLCQYHQESDLNNDCQAKSLKLYTSRLGKVLRRGKTKRKKEGVKWE